MRNCFREVETDFVWSKRIFLSVSFSVIPIETLDCDEFHQVRVLNYENPLCFYVYLREKAQLHSEVRKRKIFSIWSTLFPRIKMSKEFQREMSKVKPSSTNFLLNQTVAVEDNHKVWHRATISGSFRHDIGFLRTFFINLRIERCSVTNSSSFCRRRTKRNRSNFQHSTVARKFSSSNGARYSLSTSRDFTDRRTLGWRSSDSPRIYSPRHRFRSLSNSSHRR